MPTDDELVTALRRGMRATTANLNPAPGLAADVRQRRHQGHTRRIAAYAAVPVVAGAATAALLVGGIPTGTAPVAEPAPPAAGVSTPRPTPATTAPTAVPSPVSYQLADTTDVPQCPGDAQGAPVGKTEAGVWSVLPATPACTA